MYVYFFNKRYGTFYKTRRFGFMIIRNRMRTPNYYVVYEYTCTYVYIYVTYMSMYM